MTSKSHTLKFKRTIAAPPSEVYRAFTHATALRDWLCHAAQADARVGGRLYLWWGSRYYAMGEYTALEPGKKVAFTYRGKNEPETTRVQVTLAAKDGRRSPSGDGTLVTLTHSGLGAGAKWASMTRAVERDWPEALENLQSVMETGVDLRVARLPRLGILVDNFTPEIAAQLGVPTHKGIRLAGTFEGTGAHAAGFQKDDVLVKLGGRNVFDFPSLSEALQGRQAGDVIPVVFYRGKEKKTVKMELSKRPMPTPPATAAALAELARKNYADLDAAFAQRLEGVTEAEAGQRPAPNEWNVKELLAHFIACDRDLQSWIADMVNDNAVPDSLEFRPNVTIRLARIVERYPTLPALLEELKRSAAETVGLLAALPPEFVAHKHMYNRLASWMMQVAPSHLPDEHGDQFKATIEAARRA